MNIITNTTIQAALEKDFIVWLGGNLTSMSLLKVSSINIIPNEHPRIDLGISDSNYTIEVVVALIKRAILDGASLDTLQDVVVKTLLENVVQVDVVIRDMFRAFMFSKDFLDYEIPLNFKFAVDKNLSNFIKDLISIVDIEKINLLKDTIEATKHQDKMNKLYDFK